MLRNSDGGVSDKNFGLSYLSFWLSFVGHNLYTQPRLFLFQELALQTYDIFLYLKCVYNNTDKHIHE